MELATGLARQLPGCLVLVACFSARLFNCLTFLSRRALKTTFQFACCLTVVGLWVAVFRFDDPRVWFRFLGVGPRVMKMFSPIARRCNVLCRGLDAITQFITWASHRNT